MVFAVSSSITNILAINSDRLLAVKYPLKQKVWMSPLKAKRIIVIIWLASIITAIGLTVSEIRHVESGHNSSLRSYFHCNICLYHLESHVPERSVEQKSECKQRKAKRFSKEHLC